jgi:peptide/nickel transport system substrate-binding protein
MKRISSLSFIIRLSVFVVGVMLLAGLRPAGAQEARPDIRIALNSVPNDLCVTCDGTFPRRIVYNIFDPLIGRDFGPDGQGTAPIPALAESWVFVSDTQLDLTLREGVQFHNGATMTAEDVAFTLSEAKLWGEDALTPDALAIGVFEAVEVIDARTVRITTRFPDPALISRLQAHIGRVVPMAYFLEVGAEAFNLAPIGSGPYQLVNYEARDEVRLEAFDAYWGGTPPVASITYRDVPELSTRVAGLLAGEFDLIVGVTPQQFPLLAAEGLTVTVMPQENIQMFAFMTGPEDLPLHDARVRRALIHAADLDAIAEGLYGGLVTPLVGIDAPTYANYYDAARPRPAYDPDLARELLAEAGYEGAPIKLQFITNNFVLVNETALLLQEMWARVGLKVQLDIIPDFSLHTLNPPTDVSLWSTSNNISMPDPLNPVCTVWTADGFYASQNRVAIAPAFEDLCAQLEQTTDPDARAAIWAQLRDAWDADPQALFLWQRPEIYAYRADLAWRPLSNFSISFGPDDFPVE